MPQLAGPPQSLPSITDSLSAFPLLEPKRQQQLQDRLEAPLIGRLGGRGLGLMWEVPSDSAALLLPV